MLTSCLAVRLMLAKNKSLTLLIEVLANNNVVIVVSIVKELCTWCFVRRCTYDSAARPRVYSTQRLGSG